MDRQIVTGSVRFRVTSGALPPGLALAPSGVIYGTWPQRQVYHWRGRKFVVNPPKGPWVWTVTGEGE